MKTGATLLLCFMMASCASNGVPRGAVAGCGDFSVIGTLTKTEARGKALWLSNSDLANRLTVDDVIKLADAMGCAQ